MSSKSYKIIQLETENVKRLKAVSITPTGNIVEISGKNGNGKSSVLDSIFWALGGKDNVQEKPIRKGEKEAVTRIHLDGLTITCKFTAQDDGSYLRTLVVEADELGKIGSPQKVLDKLLGDLTFDPLEFSRMKPDKQFDMLKQFVPDFDFADEAEIRKAAFDDRTEVNRQIKAMKAQVAGVNLPDDLPAAAIDIAAISDEIQAINDANADIERRRANRERVALDADRIDGEVSTLRSRVDEYRRQITELETAIETKTGEAGALRKRLADAEPLAAPVDPSSLRYTLVRANSVNEQIRRREERDRMIDDVGKLEERAKQLTSDIEASDKRKAAAISAAQMPVPGIGFGDGYLTLDDVPFDQASSAEQLRASVLMTMAANPKLRVILVRDGSLLDADSMKMLADMAQDHDYQVWVETVDSGRPGAVIIEDGMVQGASHLEAAE